MTCLECNLNPAEPGDMFCRHCLANYLDERAPRAGVDDDHRAIGPRAVETVAYL